MAVRGSRSLSSNSSSSSSSNGATACTRLVSTAAHDLDYDCTDCGSFLFSHRARIRARPTHGARTSSSSNHHQTPGNSNNISESAQAHAQRLLLVGSHHPLILPQNEHEDYMNVITPAAAAAAAAVAVAAGDSEPVSLQASDDELVAAEDPSVMEFVACHGAAPAAQVNDSSATLAEIFRCFICLGKVVDAQLCPCCSKLVCQPCIKRWLTDQKSECPHCRAPLLVSQLVNCRFISEISLEVEKIQGKLGDSPMEKYCPAHDSPLLYFCTTCSVAVCSDCAVLIEDHRNHTFEKLSVAYGRHKKKIRMEAAGLRRRRKELSALVASVDKNIETVIKSKEESAAELHMALRRMQSRLEEQLKCKLLTLLAQKDSMTQEMELLDTILHELDQQLNSIPKSDLIAQEPNMSRMLQDIRTRTSSDISRTPIPPEFTSEVVPPYEHGELILKNFKEKLTQTKPTVFVPSGNSNTDEVMLSKDVVYSEPICGSGVAWRLKVYPNGSGASQGTHLSAFLEMVEGGNEAATYEYGVELLHRSRPNQRIVRKFSSDFKAGACWGYYQLFRIDLLEKEGYLTSDEDTITLRFYVRPLTYQQQCQDLRRSLSALQLERDESATQVAVIRRAFAATFFQRRRRRSTRAAASEQAAAAASPTLAVRKSNTKTKMPEYTTNKWLSPPQPEDNHHHSSSTRNTTPSEPQTLDPIPQTLTSPNPTSTENFTERDDEENFTEHMRPMQHERGEEAFFHHHAHKMRSHRKMRSRKVHKVLLAHPEVILSAESAAASAAAAAAAAAVAAAAATATATATARSSTSSSGDGDEAASSSSSSLLLRERNCECAAIASDGLLNNEVEELEQTYHFCTREIEAWSNLK